MSDTVGTLQRQAAALLGQGRNREAITVHQQLLKLKPKLAEAWFNLAYLLKSETRFEEALAAYEKALAAGIAGPEEVHLNRAVIYSDHLRQDDMAARELAMALAIKPDYSPALLNAGNLHEERGAAASAIACYQCILDKGPEDPQYLDALARMGHLRRPSSVEDPIIRDMQSAALQDGPLQSRANLLFSLGRTYDSLGCHSSAFEAFDKANGLVRQTGPAYARAAVSAFVDSLISADPPKPAASPESQIAQVPAPLFICGMFRSGSTLVEQVLAAHPDVCAGGEIDYLPRLAAAWYKPSDEGQVAVKPDIAGMAAAYSGYTRGLFPESLTAAYLTDKRPDNFWHIGLIKQMFPAAKIIHSVRNPMDNGLSVFMQHLHPQIAGYANRLEDIGHYYGQYRRLMAHWQSRYGGCIHCFDYDAFVADPQPQLESLLAFLDLEWNEACLNFHHVQNTVKTASYWQVRQRLYTEASGRWLNYARELQPLRQALITEGVPVSD